MNQSSSVSNKTAPWKILIADDDHDVHTVTKLVLRGVTFRGREVEFIDAYSGEETLLRLQEHPDIAVVFLDVIMETDDAGLNAARQIRENGFSLVRLILRTGYPGQAPEREVIVNYDIHDYKEKSGLSAKKLFTSLISALRAFDDLVSLESHRRGLMSVLEAVSWFNFDDVQRYIDGMLLEFSALAHLRSERVLMVARVHGSPAEALQLVASAGDWHFAAEQTPELAGFPAEVLALVHQSLDACCEQEASHGSALFVSSSDTNLVVYAAGAEAFADADRILLEVFLTKVCQALANHRTYQNVVVERDALLQGLALAAEHWDEGAAVSLQQLARLSTAIARRLETTLEFPDEVDTRFVQGIGNAAQLHDMGNLLVPAELLLKSGPLADTERSLLQEHVAAGLPLFEACRARTAGQGTIDLACQVIASHHERFDGSGYPRGLAGEAIPLAGRLVAVADAYVAMTSARPFRPALSRAEAMAAIIAGSGSAFDARVVTAFVQVLETDDGLY